jgi:hypothetical protein
MLTQLNDNGLKFVMVYVSWSNNKIEAKYNSYEGECLVVAWVVFSFWCCLYGNPFTLVTIH